MSTTRPPPPSLHRTEMLLAHREWLLALARHLVRDEHLAEDLVQDTWMAALKRPPEDRGAARGWLATVMRNLAGKALRTRGRRRAREGSVAARATAPSVDEICAEAELQTRLTRAALALPPLYRDPIVLRYFEGLALAEVAERLGVPSETARTRIKRALAQLRTELWGRDRRDGNAVYAGFVAMVARHAPPPPATSPNPAPSLTAAAVGGLVIMTKGKIAAAVAVVLLLVVGGVLATSGPDVPEPALDEAPVETSEDADRPQRRRGGAADEAAVAAAPLSYTSGTPADLEAVDRELDLHGTVVDPSGRGVGDAVLDAVTYPWRRTSLLSRNRYDDERTIGRTRSAPDGTFAMRLAPGAEVALRVSAEGFARFEVSSVQAGERLRLELTPGVTLIVDALDSDGVSVPGVRVRLFQTGPSIRARTFRRRGETDGEGRVVFDGLPPSEPAMIEGEHERLGSSGWQRTTLPDAEDLRFGLVFPRGRTLTGRVTDAVTGDPVEGAVVGRNWTQSLPVRTDADGRFVMAGWSGEGVRDIQVTAEGYGRVERDVGTTSEFEIRLQRGVSVSGRVVDAGGEAVPGVRVGVVGSERRGGVQLISVGSAIADAGGRFSVGSLRADMPHALVLTADGFARTLYDFDPPGGGERAVDLGDVALQSPGVVRGVARTADGAPIARASVGLVGANADRGRYRDAGPLTNLRYGQGEQRMTDDLGRFSFPEIAPGNYEVTVHPEGGVQASESVVLSAAGETVDVVLEMASRSRFKVVTVDVAGNPVSGVTAVLRDSRNNDARLSTGADGTAYLAFEGEPRMLYVRWAESDAYLPIDPITPDPGQTEVRIVLVEAGKVGGVVRGPRGDPIPHAMLEALQAGEPVGSAYADDAGRFEISVPAAGTVDLRLTGKALIRSGGSIQMPEIFFEGGLEGVGAGATDLLIVARKVPTDGKIRVRVVSPEGKPLPNVPVYVLGPGGPTSRADTGANGEAVIENLPHREIEVGFAGFGIPPPNPDWISPAFVKTRPGADMITLRFREGVTLRGVVVDHEGKKVENVRVVAVYGHTTAGAATDSDGRFEFRVAKGATGIKVTATHRVSRARWARSAEQVVSASDGELRVELREH